MARSLQSNLKVGRIRGVWNTALEKMDYYKKTTRGKFILCNPWSGKYIMQGPGLALKQLNKIEKN